MILKPLTDRNWKGYTLDQLQENLLLTDTRIMLRKKALQAGIKDIQETAAGGTDIPDTFSKVLRYLDYVALAVTLIRKIRPIIARFRKK